MAHVCREEPFLAVIASPAESTQIVLTTDWGDQIDAYCHSAHFFLMKIYWSGCLGSQKTPSDMSMRDVRREVWKHGHIMIIDEWFRVIRGQCKWAPRGWSLLTFFDSY
jgi:hypothetical protein